MRALLVAALLVPALAQADAMQRFHEFLRDTHSARADFEQKVYDREHRLVQASTGRFEFQRPGRFRWQTLQPFEQLIVGDGERVWIYDPDLKQVTVRPMGKALGATPAALLAGSADVERAFTFADGGRERGLEWLVATPREKESGFDSMRLGFGASGLEAMELADHFGQTTVLQFSRIARNVTPDPASFRFTPPKGVDVLGE
ncbi:MAG: outer membrane lipoprotein chaperone LolA [Burkholderiales bacterium]